MRFVSLPDLSKTQSRPLYCPAKGEKSAPSVAARARSHIDCLRIALISSLRTVTKTGTTLTACDTALLDEKIPQDIVYTTSNSWPALASPSPSSAPSRSYRRDNDVLAAIQALAQTHKTLSSGIIYEKAAGRAAPARTPTPH